MNNSTRRGLVNWYSTSPREAPATNYDVWAGPLNSWGQSRDRITTTGSSALVPASLSGQALSAGPRQMSQLVSPQTPGFTGQRNSQENSRLMKRDDRQKKFRKEIYNPTPKRITRRLSLYYRDNNAKKNNLNHEAAKGKENAEDEEDNKRCPICWEDFEEREEVTLTPCNHMFHEGCIMAWVNTNSHCPLCRYAFSDQMKETTPNLNNNNNNISYAATTGITAADLIYIITAMDEALQWG
ncbi:RING-H2 finger protein ATL54-like [Corylus avellana]|uniref:RING-H2 finger protein ATL54-like n=1 Tax=Corylus avellana TaxID=13451 RepID=UPI00286CEEA9|nr:RING-H2 finger protein ATL54-like [Corylus avellana]